MISRLGACLLGAAFVLWGAWLLLESSGNAAAQSWTPDKQAALVQLASQLRGSIVFERDSNLYTQEIGTMSPALLAPGGSYPRWSPDGKFVAFVSGKSVMRTGAEQGTAEVLATGSKLKAVAWHPDGTQVLYTDAQSIKSVDVANREVRTLVSGYSFQELDLGRDGKSLITTVRIPGGVALRAYDLSQQRSWRFARGCSASLSPDGRLVTNNAFSHKTLHILRWDNGQLAFKLNAPPGRTFDNQFWSNHPDWIVSVTDDGTNDVIVHNVASGAAIQATNLGGCDRADLFVR